MKIFIWGASSHAIYTTDIISQNNIHEICFYFDPTIKNIGELMGKRVFNNIKDLSNQISYHGVVGTIVAIGDNFVRKKVVKIIHSNFPNLVFVNAIHPGTIINNGVKIGLGNVIMAGAIIETNTVIGNHCFIATNSSLGFNNIMNDFSSISVRACTGGNCIIGKTAAINLGAMVIHNIKIGDNCIVGAGSLILHNTSSNCLYYGNPAKSIKEFSNKGYKYL